MRPRISFDSQNIDRRLELCQTVARAHGWQPNDILMFTREVKQASWYEDAMEIIEREFDTGSSSFSG